MADLVTLLTISVTFCMLGVQGTFTYGDCRDKTLVGQTYRNGSEWTAADNSCVVCKCLNGDYTCGPKVCPSDDELKCKKPIKIGHECCKRCNKRQKKRKTKKKCIKDITDRRRERRRHGRRRSRTGRRRGEKRRDRNRRQRRASGREPAFFDKLCVDARTDHLVYRHIENKTMFMAFENIRTKMVEVWNWTLRRKACDKSMSSLERCRKNGSGNIRLDNTTFTELIKRSDTFRPQITKQMLFFSTTKRQIDKIQKNLKNSMAKCQVKGSCRVKMIIRNFYHNKFRLFEPYYDCDRCN